MKKLISSSRFLIITSIVFLLAHCSANKQETNIQDENLVPVKTESIQTVNYTPVLKYSGLIASTNEAKLSFKVGGIISKIYVKEGDKVTKGQLLATLDLTEINAQVQQAQQNVDKANRDMSRVNNLFRDTVATLEQLQNATTQKEIASQGLKIAQFNQQYSQIRATEDGTILKKIANEGENISTGAPVFYFSGTSTNDWVVRFGVADKDWAVLSKGDKADVFIDAYPQKIFSGNVSELAAGADPASGTYEVEIKINPEGLRLAPGLFSKVELKTRAQQNVALVPIEALAEGDGKKGFVYSIAADGKKVKKNPVTIAFLEKDKVAISDGLENISKVITSGVGYLTEFSLVKIVN
ncbi:MAG: efflux RND transporter periplasmic adaptor subunit [Bacteroidetes bacterium]|nr:MAG: efflux RND transporter periplasmic adaptor subunit [Bacteroidota bacterium]